MAKMRAFKVENDRLPTCNDNVMSGIEDAIRRGEWTSFGIMKWNDLLIKTFRAGHQQE